MSHWLVARTHPNSEKIAIQNLQRQDFDYYQPLIQERKLKQHKLVMVEQPLFPCYLFIKVNEQYRSLNYTYGIASIVNGIVQDSIIDGLRQREQNGYIQLPKPKAYGINDKVMIVTGMFAGQQALVERMPTKQRQKILLALLANKISVLVDEQQIENAA